MITAYYLPYIVVGVLLGGLGGHFFAKRKVRQAESRCNKMLSEAEAEARDFIEQSKETVAQLKSRLKEEEKTDNSRLNHFEEDLKIQEGILDNKAKFHESFKKKVETLEKEVNHLEEKNKEVEENFIKSLEEKAKTTRDGVKDSLINKNLADFKAAYNAFIKKHEDVTEEEAENLAKRYVQAITARYKDKMPYRKQLSFTVKWRNQKNKKRLLDNDAFAVCFLEKELVTNILFDEENKQIVCSGPHLYRNAVAQGAIHKLIKSKAKIDEKLINKAIDQTEKRLEKEMIEDADQALKIAKIKNVDPEFKKVIGRLKFRTSYGQNILNHAAEAGQIGALVAAELGADVDISRIGSFLHDVGKALDHDLGGTHMELSTEMAQKYGLSEEIIHAIEAHHDDVEVQSPEALIVQTADAISSSRPGARQEFLEKYVERIQQLEETVKEFDGVKSAYALQAGREVRVKVDSNKIGEDIAPKLAHEIAEKIESELAYPGYVQVSLIRETEAVEYAGA